MHYLTLMIRDSEGGWGFIIPDVPGFTALSEKPALGQALAEAREVLTAHLTAMVDAGLDIPAARDPGDVLADPEIQEELGAAEATILLPAIIAGGRAMRVNLSLDEWTLGLIDSAARDRSLTRSAFIAQACRQVAAGPYSAPVKAPPKRLTTRVFATQAEAVEAGRMITGDIENFGVIVGAKDGGSITEYVIAKGRGSQISRKGYTGELIVGRPPQRDRKTKA